MPDYSATIDLAFTADDAEDASSKAAAIIARIREDPEIIGADLESGPDEINQEK
jgi:hypothetical protein